jgi:alkylhydroperoxidase/carboxymuconolactone decarboxylase family protein YurZ
MISESQEKAYREFASHAYAPDVLDAKTVHLVKLAAAMAIGCYP